MRQKHLNLFVRIFVLSCLPTLAGYAEPNKRLVFLGDSLTSGYTLDLDEAYPALIQKRIQAEGWPFDVVNSGISGDTTAGGLRRLDWLMRQPLAVLVIALGANDGLRGLSPAAAEANLNAMIEKARGTYPDVKILLAGMVLPENMGKEYRRAFESIYRRVAEKHQVKLMPFLLEGVAGDPDLNLPDGIHPNEKGHRILAENMWRFIEPTLSELTSGKP